MPKAPRKTGIRSDFFTRFAVALFTLSITVLSLMQLRGHTPSGTPIAETGALWTLAWILAVVAVSCFIAAIRTPLKRPYFIGAACVASFALSIALSWA